MKRYDLKDRRSRKESLAASGDLEWIRYGDTYVAGDDSLGNYIDQVFSTLEEKLNRANRNINSLNKITKHLDEGPPERGATDNNGKSLREEWFDDLESLTSEVGIRLLDPKDKAAIESDLGVITSPTFSFGVGQKWEKDIRDSVSKQEEQIKKDNAQTYNWFQKLSQDESIDAVKQTLYEMSPKGFTDAIKNSTKGFGEDTPAGVKFQDIADPQFAEFVYEREGTSQLGREVSRFIGKPLKPPEPPVDAAQTIKAQDARIAAQEQEQEQEAERQAGNQNLGSVLAAIGQAEDAQIAKEEQAKAAEIDPIFGPSGLGQMPSESVDDTNPPPGPPGPPGPSGPSAADLIAQSKANEDEVYALLQEQFGGASYFFRNNALDMKIGVTADGTIVSYDDESAENTIPLMQYIVDNGITSLSRVKGLLQKTEWWQTTDVARRTYDVMWGEMSDPERVEFLDPTTDALTKEAQFLGFDLDGDVAFTLAQTLAQNGDSEDVEAIREMIIGQLAYNEITNEFSDFSAGRDALEQLAYKYYVPQTEDAAQDWAEKIYTGEATQTEYEQYLKATAVSRFPTLDKVINEMGVTPDQYFSPYKYQIEQMLGRQVDMLDEFSDVIEYIPDAGTNARPMTLSEVRNFVRATPEWQQTDDAKDQARALALSIGQTFGEVA